MDSNDSNSDNLDSPYVASAGNSPYINNQSANSSNSNVSTHSQTQSQQSSSQIPKTSFGKTGTQPLNLSSPDLDSPSTQFNVGQSGSSTANPTPPISQTTNPTVQQSPLTPQEATPMTPQEAGFIPPSEPSKMNKKRIVLFVVLFLFIVIVVTVGYYVLTQRDTTATTDSDSEQSQVFEATPTPESITYPTTDLISQITGLLQKENYTFDGTETTVGSSGCNYVEGMQVVNNIENFSVVFLTSLAEETSPEVCEFEDVIVENLELYSIDGTYSLRQESNDEFEVIGSEDIPEKMVPQKILNSIIPYPTLLTVTNAYKAEEGMTEVEAEFATNEQNGTYTFTVNQEGLITSIVYELVTESGTYTSNGEISVDYTAETIILPTFLSTPS